MEPRGCTKQLPCMQRLGYEQNCRTLSIWTSSLNEASRFLPYDTPVSLYVHVLLNFRVPITWTRRHTALPRHIRIQKMWLEVASFSHSPHHQTAYQRDDVCYQSRHIRAPAHSNYLDPHTLHTEADRRSPQATRYLVRIREIDLQQPH